MGAVLMALRIAAQRVASGGLPLRTLLNWLGGFIATAFTWEIYRRDIPGKAVGALDQGIGAVNSAAGTINAAAKDVEKISKMPGNGLLLLAAGVAAVVVLGRR